MVDKNQLADAETLVRFANLKPNDFEDFRQKYPAFFPPSFWVPRSLPQRMPEPRNPPEVMARVGLPEPQNPKQTEWRPEQRNLYIGDTFTLANLIQPMIQEMWQTKFPLKSVIVLIGLGNGTALGDELDLEAYPYQNALMLLRDEPWRAGFCPKCGTRFVKTKPRQVFCSDQCFNVNRKAYQKKNWEDRGDKYRKNATKRKSGGKKP
jgi:hypothetical protein